MLFCFNRVINCTEIPLNKIVLKLSTISAEKEYYEKQVATLKSFEEVDALELPLDIDDEEEGNEQAQHERAMNISNGANIVLLVLKVATSGKLVLEKPQSN